MTTTDEFSEKEHDKPESGAIYFSGEETGAKLAIVRTEPISESYQKRRNTMKHYLKQFAKSIWFDGLGVALVVGIAIYSGYLGTRLDKYVDWGWITPYIPLGFISVVNVGLSMMSTRLTGRINNWGNVVGIINVFLSGCIDFILGNKAAPITYAVTFIIYSKTIKTWSESKTGQAETMPKDEKWRKIAYMTIGAFAFSFVINYIGYGFQMNTLAYVTSVAFALSLVANGLNAYKLTIQYPFWTVYNFVQLAKAFVQGNFANVGKYIFYIINAFGAQFLWDDSEDK